MPISIADAWGTKRKPSAPNSQSAQAAQAAPDNQLPPMATYSPPLVQPPQFSQAHFPQAPPVYYPQSQPQMTYVDTTQLVPEQPHDLERFAGIMRNLEDYVGRKVEDMTMRSNNQATETQQCMAQTDKKLNKLTTVVYIMFTVLLFVVIVSVFVNWHLQRKYFREILKEWGNVTQHIVKSAKIGNSPPI